MPPRKKKSESTSAKAKNSDARVTENLRKIYENPDGSLPDMKTIESEPRHRGWKILLKLVVVGVLGLTGFLAWKISVAPRLQFNDEIAVTLSGPKEVAPKTMSTYTVRYRNPGASPVRDMAIYFEHPDYFVVSSSSRAFEPESQKIIIGNLSAKESGEVTIMGVWGESIPENINLTAVLTYTPNNFSSVFEKRSGLEILAPKTEVVVTTSTPSEEPQPVSVTFTSNVKEQTVEPGTGMIFDVIVQNLGAEPITNGTVVLSVVAPSVQNKSIMNWGALQDPLDGTVVGAQVNSELRRGSITWTAKEWKELANLTPGAKTQVEIRLPVKTMREAGFADFTTSTITATAELRSGNQTLFTSSPAIATIQSDTTFSPSVRKTDTGYEFSFTIENNLHPLKDILAEVELFGEFTWDQAKVSVGAGAVEFDPKTKTVRWKISSLPLESGATTLTFPIKTKHNPTQTQVTGKIKFTALDAVVNKVWTVNFDGLKTPQ